MFRKKTVSILLTLALLLTAALPALSVHAAAGGKDAHIAFNADGKLRILQIADLQDDEELGRAEQKLLRAAVEKTKPDLIVMTGDNIAGYDCPTKEDAEAGIRAFMDILDEYGIPVAAVFGNHDDDRTPMTKEEEMDIYTSYPCFIGSKGVVASRTVEGGTMHNVGTYNIPVYAAADSDQVVYNIWCFDSGTYNPDPGYGGYGYVLPEQIDWYVRTSEALQAANGGQLVPSIAFQHIAPPQIYAALKEVPRKGIGAVEQKGKYYVLPDGVDRMKNWLSEAPCPPDPDFADGYRQLDTMIERGDVRAIFYGHDHVNHYIVPYKGVDLVSSAGCTYQAYNDIHRGFRVITLDKADLQTYETTYYSAIRLLSFAWLPLTAVELLHQLWMWIANKLNIAA